MGKKQDYSFTRLYLRLHLGLRKRCDRLSQRQRKVIVYSLSIAYLICAIAMIAQLFISHKEPQEPPFSVGELVDSPIQRDTLHLGALRTDTYLAMNQYEY